MKNLKDQLYVNGNNTWKSVSCISHKNYIHKATENSNCGIKTFNRFTPLAPDIYICIHLMQMIQEKMMLEESKKPRKVSHCATTPYFATTTTTTTKTLVF